MLIGQSFEERPASFEVPAVMSLKLVICYKTYAASMKRIENCFQPGVSSSEYSRAEQRLHSPRVLISQIFV